MGRKISAVGHDRRGRIFPDALLPPGASQSSILAAPGVRARSRQGLLQGGFGRVVAADGAEVFRRILQPVWSTALASGRKWVEVQKYTCATSRNAMKFASAGKIILFCPSGTTFGQVHGAAVLAGKASVGQPMSQAVRCASKISSDLHEEFHQYMEGGQVFDSVDIARVYDLRGLGWTSQTIAQVIGVAMPKQTQGFPCVGGDKCRDRLVALLAEVPQHVFPKD